MGTDVLASVPAARPGCSGTVHRARALPFSACDLSLGPWLEGSSASAPWDSLDQADAVARVEHVLSVSVDDDVAMGWRHPDDVRRWWAARVASNAAEAREATHEEAHA